MPVPLVGWSSFTSLKLIYMSPEEIQLASKSSSKSVSAVVASTSCKHKVLDAYCALTCIKDVPSCHNGLRNFVFGFFFFKQAVINPNLEAESI